MKPSCIHRIKKAAQHGLTMVELLVALVLVSLITLAALAMYNASSSTYRSTDANQELQDNARFIFETFSQAIRQAGLQDSAQYAAFEAQVPRQAVFPPSHAWDTARFGTQPALFGYNDAKIASVGSVTDFGTDDSGGHNNSDVFGVRFFGSSRLTDASTADRSVIDCRGNGVAYPLVVGDIGLSLFQVATGTSGEPELQCINQGRVAYPIVRGVESLQIVYAVDTNVGATTDPSPNRWLNAKEVSAGAFWPKVRAVRLGMVLSAAAGSATGAPNAAALYPLGEEFSKVSGAVPSTNGITFVPPNDNRLRRAFTFNIAIRKNVEQ